MGKQDKLLNQPLGFSVKDSPSARLPVQRRKFSTFVSAMSIGNLASSIASDAKRDAGFAAVRSAASSTTFALADVDPPPSGKAD